MKSVKISKKKIIIIAVAAALLVAAVVLIIVFLPKNNAQKTVVAKVDHSYSELAKKESLSLSEAEKSLKDYAKTQTEDGFVYTKGKETVHIKTDAKGNVVYISYNNALTQEEKAEITDFNESMIQIGDEESAVLALLEKDAYVYNLKTINDEGKKLHIYYYGWTGSEAILELVFTDGKLSYYTLNSDEIANKSDVDPQAMYGDNN